MDLEKISVKIIANSGEAKSLLFEAIDMAQQNYLNEAWELVNQAREKITFAEKIHMDVLREEANGGKPKLNLLLIHAEDHMMSGHLLVELTERFINMYEKYNDSYS